MRSLAGADSRGPAIGDSDVKRCLGRYRHAEIHTVVLEGSFLDYLVKHAASIQLVTVGAAQTAEVRQLLGAAGALSLRDSDFSLLVVGLERPGR